MLPRTTSLPVSIALIPELRAIVNAPFRWRWYDLLSDQFQIDRNGRRHFSPFSTLSADTDHADLIGTLRHGRRQLAAFDRFHTVGGAVEAYHDHVGFTGGLQRAASTISSF